MMQTQTFEMRKCPFSSVISISQENIFCIIISSCSCVSLVEKGQSTTFKA